ncbi:DNA alkylation repair protein [Ornithinibacillus scapharcae]|uniref:DNA alkylation repair protein n=1 Tax=Ornithinibacillus scapharcae TaxID=1147159 RepID=UPI000225B34B|nr:DNA alkylation repair protein [Ornithinibacillus scapharcae]
MISKLIEELEKNRDNHNAIQMEKYMRNLFPFLGIKTPDRKKISTEFFKDLELNKKPFQVDLVLDLWEMKEREYQYIALDYMDRNLSKIELEHTDLFQTLITTKSWWDTVDMLAQKPVGQLVRQHPEIIANKINKWSTDENIWLKRTAILFQLKYKEDTNEDLLYTYIKRNVDSKEFFIQKAIGWALREYSKTNPTSVQEFIKSHELAKLSIREGSKYL